MLNPHPECKLSHAKSLSPKVLSEFLCHSDRGVCSNVKILKGEIDGKNLCKLTVKTQSAGFKKN